MHTVYELGTSNFETMFTAPCVSHIRCQLSCVMCQVSGVPCHICFCNKTKNNNNVELLVGGSVINGATPSSFVMHDKNSITTSYVLQLPVHAGPPALELPLVCTSSVLPHCVRLKGPTDQLSFDPWMSD